MKTTLLMAALSSVLLPAQEAPSPPIPRFDVVSVKTCKPGAMVPGGSSPGRLHIGCGRLADTDNTGLIQVAYNRYASGRLSAYGVLPIEGAPDWVHSETFEIEQLGLKLIPAKGPVDVLVIEHIERPSEN